MKISAKQKQLNRLSLLKAAVEVFSEHGYQEASLRQVSARAGMSDPVVYSYFPNKQALLYGYLEHSLELAFEKLVKIPSFEKMGFAEQIQLLMESHLEVLEADKKFVAEIFPMIFVTGLATAQEALQPCRNLFKDFVNEALGAAIAAGEFQTPPFQDTIASMFWDFHAGVLSYWLNDKSEMSSATSELMQRSMGVISEVLKSGFLPRLVDLAYFLIRTHLIATPFQAAAAAPEKKKSDFLQRFNGASELDHG